MTFLGTLLAERPYYSWPTAIGWGIWCVLLVLLLWLLLKWRQYRPSWKGGAPLILLALLLSLPLTTLFLGLRLSSGSSLPIPGVPAETGGAAMLLFAAVPWTLAGGVLGPVGAAIVGAFAGLLRGLWDTHNVFTPLIFALLGVLFSASVRQRYRTPIFRLLRQPLISALSLLPVYSVLYVVGAAFTLPSGVPGALTARLDYALSTVGNATLAMSGELLVAGMTAQVLSMIRPAAWGRELPLRPSPAERSMETRFVLATSSFVSLLLLTLLIGDWLVAGNAARSMLRERLASTATMAAETVPFFLETGQNLGVQLASDPRLLTAQDPELSAVLGQRMQSVPYFNELIVVTLVPGEEENSPPEIRVLGGYPPEAREAFVLSPEEKSGVPLAFASVWNQIYTLPPSGGGRAARVSFLVAILDDQEGGVVSRVLIGRTDLATNPITRPLISSLDGMVSLGGEGILLDEDGNILYHPQANLVMSHYSGALRTEAAFYDDTAADGTRQLVYYQPVVGRPWAVVLTIPAQQAQQLALNIAAPLTAMILILAVIALASLRVGLGVVTRSLQTLASEAMRIAQGKLDRPLQVSGVDEVGQLRRAFEQMRVSLRARLEELNRLLTVSLGVASSLEMQDAVRPVLEAVLAMGADSVRVVLSPSALPETLVEAPSRFALGPAKDDYAYLDDQILALAEKQEKVILPNMARARNLPLEEELPKPASLLAVALRHENRYYGVLWAAFARARMFSDADVRFVTTLAGHAALAAANAYLFQNVEVGRRQLEAILASTPDPILVTDAQNRILLINPAAEVLGLAVGRDEGRSIDQALQEPTLLGLFNAPSQEKQSAEVILPDGRTYLATASTVVADGNPVGRVCILRDVTHFKELDTLKSEFVATVSHDLRSPLTLMRGYATMLEMVGELNEQQRGYVRKIISGVENMSRLVNNLLDLGRIEIGVGLQLEEVPVLDIVERVTGALKLQAEQKKIRLDIELAKDLPSRVEADQALLHQAVFNLVENAIKYTPSGGRVVLRLRRRDGALLFEIQDNGIGIAREDLPHLFEKFFRGRQREARAQHGTGLGLAIVRSIAERHGGRVWVESELGKGSTFYLQIPIVQSGESSSS